MLGKRVVLVPSCLACLQDAITFLAAAGGALCGRLRSHAMLACLSALEGLNRKPLNPKAAAAD